MSKVFISYTTSDRETALYLHQALVTVGADPFLAEISLAPGVHWTQEIFRNLRESQWVFFVASKAACGSPSVQQELGASLIQNKHIIPILIDIGPEELPGWIKQYQAIDARKDGGRLSATISAIGKQVRDDKFWSGIVLGGIGVALLATLGGK